MLEVVVDIFTLASVPCAYARFLSKKTLLKRFEKYTQSIIDMIHLTS